VDVYYPASGGARAALVVAEGPRFDTLVEDRVCWLPEVAEYRPGEFFARELPAVSAVLGEPGDLALVVIDGYVDLDPDGRAGLGAHLHAQIHAPVIGVAKTAFHTASHAIAVRRGAATDRCTSRLPAFRSSTRRRWSAEWPGRTGYPTRYAESMSSAGRGSNHARRHRRRTVRPER
jgi:deoxyinosine 3'endonuclease (endonuclease V)